MDTKRNINFYICAFLICFVYLVLRLSFPETIEFGYDQPRLATRIIEFIDYGKILETQKFAEKAPWGNISWGPALFYFYSPFLLVTRNPLMLSYLIAIFNIASVAGVIYLGSHYISKKAGLFAGLILATQPWWVIFSRMIYQPTPVITLILISMIFYFITLKKPNSIYYSLLILSWTFLIEIYFHTFSFVLISLVLTIVFNYKKLLNKYLIIGILLSGLLVIPFGLINSKSDYLPNRNQVDEVNKFADIPIGFIKTISGLDMKYQLGYGYDDFNEQYIFFDKISLVQCGFIFIVLFYNVIRLFLTHKGRRIRATLLLWAFAPLFFLILIPLPNVPPIPRYFLVSFPAIAFLCGIFFSEVYKHSKLVLLSLIVPVFWIYFSYSYSIFIGNYNFPNGHLSVFSDTQYLFLFNAIKSARDHNIENGRDSFILSNDDSAPKEISLDYATKYIWLNVFNYKMISNSLDNGYYLIDYSLQKDNLRYTKLGRFGPYSLYEFKDLL